ncbi:MAG: glycosyltransferase [Pseudomonadota bacterium]|nr:glycosyltransferase [Pseudomonadota bacterium]
MPFFPIFLSVVFVVRDQADHLESLISDATAKVSKLVGDYEIIIVDNASADASLITLKRLTAPDGYPNLQVYALTKEVDNDTASWVGLENALGDFVAVVDPTVDDAAFLPAMLEHAAIGADVVFAANDQKPRQSVAYRMAFFVFNALWKSFNGIHLAKEAPQYRLLSKRVVNFILQHPQPSMTYRHLPATGGFARVNLTYSAKPRLPRVKAVGENLDRGMRLLLSSTRGPMRLVTSLSLFGALANLGYASYVVVIALFKSEVAPGWVSLSLQQSGMFFLISLVLMVLGEYILNMVRLSSEGPLYHVGQEFTSAQMTRRNKLNIETVGAALSETSVAVMEAQ